MHVNVTLGGVDWPGTPQQEPLIGVGNVGAVVGAVVGTRVGAGVGRTTQVP